MIRGGGAPNKGMAPEPLFRLDPPPRSFAADAHGCIMVRAPRGPPDTRLRRDDPRARWRAPLGLARNRLPAQQNWRNAAAELEPNSNLDIDVPIQGFMSSMLDRGHHVCLCRGVAGELVRDHHTRHAGLPFQKLAKQTLGG